MESLKKINIEYQEYLAEKDSVCKTIQKEKDILTKRYKEVVESLNEKYDLLFSEIEKEKRSKLDLIEEKYQNLIRSKEELMINISNHSTFTTDKIGKVIATLISAFEEKEYHYFERPFVISFIDFYEQYPVREDVTYRAGLITTSNNFYLKNGVVLYSRDKITDLLNSRDILLYCLSDPITKITLYDYNGNFLLGEKYPYVKDFIDILISKRMDNKDFNIDEELSNFIFENKQNLKRVKK